MEHDPPVQDLQSSGPRRCATCGTPYPSGVESAVCPVCMFRRLLDPEGGIDSEWGIEGGLALEDLSFYDDGRFDHYELVRQGEEGFDELGRGAMGITYRAIDSVLGHPVALKVIDARVSGHPEARERFFREARAAARLRHPNVASVLYYGVRKSDDRCFYAMELVEGETLQTRIRRAGPVSTPFALEVVAQIARAMCTAEAQGLVHRDLKPANLMLTNEPEVMVKIIDFGLAKAATYNETDITQGGFVGTPAYASPEQFKGASVDSRSDLYSLGVTLWDMLTGRALFEGSQSSLMHQHQHALLPVQRLQGVPQPMVVLLEVLLDKDPARRFQSPGELLKALPTIKFALDSDRAMTRQSLQESFLHPAAVARGPGAAGRPKKISFARLPITGIDVFGREDAIAFLDNAWANEKVNVATIVAWAGVGKSTLVNHWLRRMAAEQYRSAELIYGWSFYRQGSSGESSSADEFLHAALDWFGDSDPRRGTAWEKGERLAKLVAHRRVLLILDGLEPLQNPPGSQEGRVREPSLQALLRELCAFNTGLCVITTRIPVADIANCEGTTAMRRDLEQLSSEAGAKLLRASGVKGSQAQLESASNEFGGHSLALTLLGSYLSDAFNGEIRFHKEVSKRLAHDVRQGVQAQKVMESYRGWFGEGAELSVLRLLGLFDRPAGENALRTLLKPPAIRGLTEFLVDLGSTEWRTILSRLRRAKLLAPEDSHDPGHLDTHPLVREYFGGDLRTRMPEAWKESNRRLSYYYRTMAPQLPDSFREMEPLFLAAICGCNAGLYREVLHEIYIARIQRGSASFAAKVLGARGALLSVFAHFFEGGRWGSPAQTDAEGQALTAEDQLFLLTHAALLLTATQGLGTPQARICYERAEPLCHSLNRPLLLYLALTGQWRHSFMTDKLSTTMRLAERVHSLAIERNDLAIMIGSYRALAFTLYYLGEFETALEYARRGVQLWRSGLASSTVEEINSPTVSCLVFQALSEWHFAEIDASKASMAEAVSLAKELNDMHGLAVALIFSGVLAQLGDNPSDVERLASEVIELSTRQQFAGWLAGGAILRGWSRSISGETAEGLSAIEEGLEDLRATGSILNVPYCLGLKAEALHLGGRTSDALAAIVEAEALIKRSEERWSYAELHRLRAVFLASIGADGPRIEASFREAISTAKQQKSTSLAKRAEATYANYRHP
jgi:tetratricopeptide (TPR) repeat protein